MIGLDKFLALKLVSNNQVYYGWARLNVGYSSNLLVLKDYAINTIPDSSVVTAINPGCGGAVSLAPSGYQVYCSNDSLAVTVLNSAGQNVQWLKNGNWIAGETDSLFYISQPGNYAALVFDSVCSVIATTVQVAQEHFTLDASAADEHCGLSNGSVNVYANGNSSGFHYLWSNGATTYHVSGLSAGVYEVTVTSAICPDTAITSVEVLNTSGPQLFETHTDSVCNHNGDINLSVTNGAPPYTYHWNTNSASQDLHNLDAGIYSVTVHDASGCYLFETITLLNAGPQLSQIHTTTCDSTSSIDLTVNGGVAPFSYLWNIGQTTEDLNNLSPATYSVTVTDNNGCSSSLGVAVSSGPFPHPIIYQTGNVLNTSTAFTSYQWYLNGNIIPGATNYQFTPQQSGSYKVVAVDSTGCSGTSIAFYFAPVNVNDPERDFQFTVTVDNNKNLLFHLANNALMGAQIDIVNELGQLAASVTVTNQTPGADLSALPGGIYFYHIRSKQKTYSGKFIIE
ncbi:MAG: T9SS type A sorting domain-containing protein [Bacteroidota bacterium]